MLNLNHLKTFFIVIDWDLLNFVLMFQKEIWRIVHSWMDCHNKPHDSLVKALKVDLFLPMTTHPRFLAKRIKGDIYFEVYVG